MVGPGVSVLLCRCLSAAGDGAHGLGEANFSTSSEIERSKTMDWLTKSGEVPLVPRMQKARSYLAGYNPARLLC